MFFFFARFSPALPRTPILLFEKALNKKVEKGQILKIHSKMFSIHPISIFAYPALRVATGATGAFPGYVRVKVGFALDKSAVHCNTERPKTGPGQFRSTS